MNVELGFNLNKTFENHLKPLITQFSTGNSVNNFKSTENKLRIEGLPVPIHERVQNLFENRRQEFEFLTAATARVRRDLNQLRMEVCPNFS
jgi:hypothetical protein